MRGIGGGVHGVIKIGYVGFGYVRAHQQAVGGGDGGKPHYKGQYGGEYVFHVFSHSHLFEYALRGHAGVGQVQPGDLFRERGVDAVPARDLVHAAAFGGLPYHGLH